MPKAMNVKMRNSAFYRIDSRLPDTAVRGQSFIFRCSGYLVVPEPERFVLTEYICSISGAKAIMQSIFGSFVIELKVEEESAFNLSL
jgi:hypothetical protein